VSTNELRERLNPRMSFYRFPCTYARKFSSEHLGGNRCDLKTLHSSGHGQTQRASFAIENARLWTLRCRDNRIIEEVHSESHDQSLENSKWRSPFPPQANSRRSAFQIKDVLALCIYFHGRYRFRIIFVGVNSKMPSSHLFNTRIKCAVAVSQILSIPF